MVWLEIESTFLNVWKSRFLNFISQREYRSLAFQLSPINGSLIPINKSKRKNPTKYFEFDFSYEGTELFGR